MVDWLSRMTSRAPKKSATRQITHMVDYIALGGIAHYLQAMQIPRRVSLPTTFSRNAVTDVVTDSERAILDRLRRFGTSTRAELTHASKMAPQSTARLIDGLVTRGFLRLGDKVRNGRGQPTVQVDIVPGSALSIGVSIMSDAVSVGVMDLGGGMVRGAVATDLPMTLDSILAFARKEADRLVEANGHDRTRLLGLGVAVSGNFTGTGARLATTHWLEDLAGRDLDIDFEAAFGLPTLVENDGTAAAIGEALVGMGRTFTSFAYIFFGAGLGGGLVVDGSPWRGFNGNAGEFSRSIPLSEIPDRPTLESLRALVGVHGVELASVAELESRFDLAWPGVEAWLERARRPLLQIIAAITSVADPEAIVFGGRLPQGLGERLVAAVANDVDVELTRSAPLPQLVAATNLPDGALYGAAALPLHRYFYR